MSQNQARKHKILANVYGEEKCSEFQPHWSPSELNCVLPGGGGAYMGRNSSASQKSYKSQRFIFHPFLQLQQAVDGVLWLDKSATGFRWKAHVEVQPILAGLVEQEVVWLLLAKESRSPCWWHWWGGVLFLCLRWVLTALCLWFLIVASNILSPALFFCYWGDFLDIGSSSRFVFLLNDPRLVLFIPNWLLATQYLSYLVHSSMGSQDNCPSKIYFSTSPPALSFYPL